MYEFKSKIVREVFYNQDSAWGVFEFETNEDIPYFKKTPNFLDGSESCKKTSTLVGKTQKLDIGFEYIIKATPVFNDKYNVYQYSPLSVSSCVPKTVDEQKRYLEQVISPRLANNLLDAYPEVIDDIINNKEINIDFSKVKGLGQATWERVKNKIIETYVASDLITLLQPIGVTFNMINKLMENYENYDMLKQELDRNPYILTSIHGLGFKKVDKIALGLNPELLFSKFRLEAYVKYYLTELGNNSGHTFVKKQTLINNISNNVPECRNLLEELLVHNSFLKVEDEKIGLISYYKNEIGVLNCLLERNNYKNDKFTFEDNYVNEIIKEVEEEQGFQYIPDQLKEIRSIINDEVSLISGLAGTGKTSIMRAVLRLYIKKGFKVSCCSLSAKAAIRITEATGSPATTIHKLLGARGFDNFVYNEENKLYTDLLFVDEASMINASLFLKLIRAINYSTRIIICGDHKQLPPIGYGNVFSDLLKYSDTFKVHILTKVMRQAEKSGMITDGNKIRMGINPIVELEPKITHGELKDMYYMFRDNREVMRNIAINTFLSSIKTDGIDNVQILVPRRQECINSTTEINKIIQEKLLSGNKTINSGYLIFYEGAKVRQTKNNSQKNVFNGEVGYIEEIFTETNSQNKVTKVCNISFRDELTNENRTVKYKESELKEIDLAYAMTCHSVQGSGYATVIGIIDNTHYTLLDNCMLYTMISRGKKRCLLLSEPQAFVKCINTSHNDRNTWLREMIENKK